MAWFARRILLAANCRPIRDSALEGVGRLAWQVNLFLQLLPKQQPLKSPIYLGSPLLITFWLIISHFIQPKQIHKERA